MAAGPSQIFVGCAQIAGAAGTLTFAAATVVYPQQTGKGSHKWDMEVTKDPSGQDCAWLSRNEMVEQDFTFKLVGQVGPVTVLATLEGTNNAQNIFNFQGTGTPPGATPYTPFTAVVLTGFQMPYLNDTWYLMSDDDVSIVNDKVAEWSVKLRKYVSHAQNVLFGTATT